MNYLDSLLKIDSRPHGQDSCFGTEAGTSESVCRTINSGDFNSVVLKIHFEKLVILVSQYMAKICIQP